MAWVRVWHGGLAPMPQQPRVSSPLTESTFRVAPSGSGVQHTPAKTSQKSPPPQLEASVQLLRQAVAPQTNGEQSVVAWAGQFPWPSQKVALVWVLPLQLCCPVPQAVVLSGKTQAPVRGSQSVAPQGVATLVQVLAQQLPEPPMPHTPDAHSSLAPQAPMVVLATQAPAWQKNPAAQSAVLPQLVTQVLPAALQAS